MGPMVVPLLEVGTVPFHVSLPVPPVAAQVLALVLCQLSEVDKPVTRVLGKALNETTAAAGGGALLTFTITELGAPGPAAPEHVSV